VVKIEVRADLDEDHDPDDALKVYVRFSVPAGRNTRVDNADDLGGLVDNRSMLRVVKFSSVIKALREKAADRFPGFECLFAKCRQKFYTKRKWFDHMLHCPQLNMVDLSRGQESMPVSVYANDVASKDGLFRAFQRYSSSYVFSEHAQIRRKPAPTTCLEAGVDIKLRNFSECGFRTYSGACITECRIDSPVCRAIRCTNNVVQRGLRIPLQVFFSDKGWGVRTLVPIQAQTFVCEYVGEVCHDEEVESKYAREEMKDSDYLLDLDGGGVDDHPVVDAARIGNVARFFNHSCEPNLEKQCVRTSNTELHLTMPSTGSTQNLLFTRLAFFAKRYIYRFEELTWDYGMNAGATAENQPCLCGTDSCRGFLSS